MEHHTPPDGEHNGPGGTRTSGRQQRVEAKNPDGAVNYMMERVIDPLETIKDTAAKVGFPERAAKCLEARLHSEYAPLVEEVKIVTQDILEQRISRRLNASEKYFTDERLAKLFEGAKLKDVAITEAVWVDKLLAARSTPVTSVSHKEQQSFDQVLQAIQDTLKSRGLTATATERKVEITAK